MKLNRFFSAVLSAALLAGLCACGPDNPAVDDPSAGVSVSARPSLTSQAPGTPKLPPEDGASPEPTLPPVSEYDRNHRLDAAVPELVNGLELPVAGATGYTCVELPLWESIPGWTPQPGPSVPQPAPSPAQPAPTPSAPPAVTETPAPPPAETSAPVPTETPAPPPAETSAPVPTETPAPPPAETSAPVPTETPAPPPAETGGPVPDDPVASVPVQAPDIPTQAPEEPELPPVAPPEEPAAPAPLAARTRAPLSAGAANPYAGAVAVWEPGIAFVILEENGGWWRVSRGGETGWIEHRYCMINLPDVIPSIIYDDASAYSSRFVSSGKPIPGVTGEALYHSLAYNIRLDRQEFVMPLLYSAARNVCAAQRRALAEGNCLVIYQAYRSYDTQTAVAEALARLAGADPEVQAGLSTPPWSMDWFISTGFFNHHQGYALDAGMVKVYGAETRYAGAWPYLRMTEYAQYQMPTAVHELSLAAASTVSPGSSQLSQTMNGPAIALREYFTASGLSPLDSEWWHFSDAAAMRQSSANPGDGRYEVTECLSCPPEQAARAALGTL